MHARFLEWTQAIGLAEQTARIRSAALGGFIRWCDGQGIRSVEKVTREALERYQLHLVRYRKANGVGLALSTQATRLHPIRAFCSWLAREGRVAIDPSRDLVMAKLPRRLPRCVPSYRDIERILGQADVATHSGLCDRAMMEVLYATGVRRMELVNLQVWDINVPDESLMVRCGKGRRDRVVPIGRRAARWVESYLVRVRPRLLADTDPGALFLTDYGEPFRKNRLGDLVKRYLASSRLGMPGACHLFRHACATHMLENGADIRFIQAMLGHADLSTTQIYTHVAIGPLRAVHSATHPGARYTK
ncbi:MAG: tyrosine-type recombinase/integrase [Candidatus Methylomirabilis sp.]